MPFPFFNEQQAHECGPLGPRKPRDTPKTMPTFNRSTISEKTMSGDNIERGILKDLPNVILLRIGNGEVIEILTMGSTSVERCDRKDFVAIRMICPKITKTH